MDPHLVLLHQYKTVIAIVSNKSSVLGSLG
jgi:hypothetical protein